MITYVKNMFALRKQDDRGATAVVIAIFMSAFVLSMALALDTGVARAHIRNMQGVADIVSMDMARKLDGSKANQLETKMNTQLIKILTRNNLNQTDALRVTYKLGTINQSTNTFVEAVPTTVPEAVKVIVNGKSSRYFAGGAYVHERTAIAMGQVTAEAGADCFSIGSYAALEGTPAANAMNGYMQKAATQTTIFWNNGTFMSTNFLPLMGQDLNMTRVAQRMGHSNIASFATATVGTKLLFKALADQATSEGLTESAAVFLAAYNTTGPEHAFPLSVMLGNNLSGTVRANALDVFGGIVLYHNTGERTVDPYFGSILSPVQNAGYNGIFRQGPRIHCAKPGQPVATSTETNLAQYQATIISNGNVNFNPPYTYTFPRVESPTGGSTPLIGSGFNVVVGSPNNAAVNAKIDPIQMTLTGASCDVHGRKTATFSIAKGDMEFTLGNFNVGDYVGNWSNVPIKGQSARVSFSGDIRVKIKLRMAGKTATVVAEPDDADKPLYFWPGGTELEIEYGWANGDNFIAQPGHLSVVNQSWQEISLTTAEKNLLAKEIAKAHAFPLYDLNTSNSYMNIFIAPILGTAGASVNGPAIIFPADENGKVSCGAATGSTSKTTVKLVG